MAYDQRLLKESQTCLKKNGYVLKEEMGGLCHMINDKIENIRRLKKPLHAVDVFQGKKQTPEIIIRG